jgi:hypothetical protein
MHSVANAYIDFPAVAFTPNAQFLPTATLKLELKELSDYTVMRNDRHIEQRLAE